MSAIKGDFTGFTFNGIHSSELGITRVSDGSRYSENLLPTIQDKTVQMPGADGTYYFGSFYTQRPINISVAFDDLSEEQLRQLKAVFGDKKIHDLIFDEVPYKVYRVKSTGTPNLKYVCFNKDEDENDRAYKDIKRRINTKEELYSSGARSPYGRVYKGEGQLNFVAYEPYARSRFKYIDQYVVQNIPEWGSMDTSSAEDVHYNLYDWVDSAGLRLSDSSLVTDDDPPVTYQLDKVYENGVVVYNPGDLPTHFSLYFLLTGNFNGATISLDEDRYMELNPFTIPNSEIGFRINGKLNLIEGIIEDEDSIKYVRVWRIMGRSPAGEGWYEWDNDQQIYVLTQDSTAQPGTIYYERKVNYIPTGTIYNEYIDRGDFFKLPKTPELVLMTISTSSNFSGLIEYNYLYF